MRILVADDSKTGLAILTASLRDLGHEVVGAATGEQAIELFVKVRPDFVILDVVMPTMGGFECAKELRKIHSENWIPIIFLSASIDDDSISQGVDAGGDDYLMKPVSQITLAAKIKAMQRIADTQKKLYEISCKLSVLSSTDILTGMDNRLQFSKAIGLQIAYAKRYHAKLALLFLDLDHFKDVNDHFGHQIGDMLLKEAASRIKCCLRKHDFLARLGGDEFAIILSKINHPREAGYVAQKILDVFNADFCLNGQYVHITCSIGIACYPTCGNNPEILAQHADIAMYYAKDFGRNNFQHYMDSLQVKRNERFFLENALRFALENKELFICYQPVFHLRTRKMVGMEALMRWKHPKFGLIEPEIFIPLAEETGLIRSIGNWALNCIYEQASIWYKSGYKKFKLLVNISSQQLLQLDLMDVIIGILDETRFPARLIEFELTESTAMSVSMVIEKTIHDISALKIGISLDDFGTGYSSLSHLKRLPITTLKIDKSFVMDITHDPNDALIVKSIIVLG